jgi:hypothetical protein
MLNKQALIDHLNRHDDVIALSNLRRLIQSGRFDIPNEADQLREEVKRLEIALYTHESYDKSVSELYQEIERLRAALEQIANYERDEYESYLVAYAKCKLIAIQALSGQNRPGRNG